MVDIQAHASNGTLLEPILQKSAEEEREGVVNFFNVKPLVSEVRTYKKVNYTICITV